MLPAIDEAGKDFVAAVPFDRCDGVMVLRDVKVQEMVAGKVSVAL